jgi:2-haloacid dehalogenase
MVRRAFGARDPNEGMTVRTVAFDIIGTLFPLDPVRAALTAQGAPERALDVWFASALRD